MASVQDINNEIDRIGNAKSGIAQAIEEKGVQVPESSKIEEYPGFVRQIQAGSTDAVLYTPQDLTSEQQQQARTNIGATAPEVFVVIKNITTWQEITDAYNAGKIVVMRDGSEFYYLMFLSDYAHLLLSFSGNISQYSYWRVVKENNVYNYYTKDIQLLTDRVNAWQSTPDNNHYPSEKLVYDSLYKRGVISQTQTWTRAADGGYDYVMSDLVQGNIPRYFVDLWKSRGGETADFNTTTGYFEYLDLKDISYNEALQIYGVSPTVFGYAAFANSKMPRAIFPQLGNGGYNGSVNLYAAFLRCGNLESFTFKALYCDEATISNNVATLIYGNTRLKYIGGVIKIKTSSDGGEFANDALSLETISIMGLRMGINFADSPRLSVASILYMIQNEAASNAITITLHATAYARAMADADVQAALTAHPNVSLVSA